MKCALESQEQKYFVRWASMHPICKDFLFAIPNGGYRGKREAKSLVEQGVKKGIPDLMLAYACGPYHGLFIEMKRRHGSVTSIAQHRMMDLLLHNNYLVVIAKGWEEAVYKTKEYLNLGGFNERERR